MNRNFSYEEVGAFLKYLKEEVGLTEQTHVSQIAEKLFSTRNSPAVAKSSGAPMTEDIAPAELDEAEQPQEAAADEDEELYSLTTPSSPTSASRVARGEDDDSPYHQIDFMHDVPLHISVEIGHTQLTVREILALKVGQVAVFTKVVGEPMDITVSGRLMARGEVVVVNERYGVRITEVTRPDETEIAAKEAEGI